MAKMGVEVITMLAGNIRLARNKTELTQEVLADKIGVKRAALASWETGRAKPDIDDFMKLCCALKIKPEELSGFSFEYELSGLQQPVVELAKILATLPPTVFPLISKMIRSLANEVKGEPDEKI